MLIRTPTVVARSSVVHGAHKHGGAEEGWPSGEVGERADGFSPCTATHARPQLLQFTGVSGHPAV